jgi:hypothetical protein
MSTNAGMFPYRPSVEESERETRVVTLGTEAAAALCSCLASETASAILARLFEEPTTTATLADDVGTSVQNAHYHLDRLRDADLVRVVETWYSSRGVEMDVYAPTHDEVVVAPPTADGEARAGDDRQGDGEPPTLIANRSP